LKETYWVTVLHMAGEITGNLTSFEVGLWEARDAA